MRFLQTLSATAEKLKIRLGKPTETSSKYVNLAPTSKADQAGIYYEALSSATNDPDVYNIALTGPYGSGKSSVIKSFLTKYRRPTLQISLASFLPDAENTGGAVSKQEIERSILQQMLYGADANKLPLSRFKRIQSPKWWSRAVSLFIILGCFALWYLFQRRADIISGVFFKPFELTNWFNFLCFAFGFVFIWQALHHIYIKSFGLSLKSVSLKDVEIAPEAAQEESILNRHLDEIIYFFQSTKYDLVIIEDLDRFNNPDIFVTLREINGLINANAGVRWKIRFLYALRDDMFINTDRTKFFEFIVPVIPIINHSNSIDKVLEQGQRLALEERLDSQFIREVSRYLNDLRLIRNIFNEYAIYVSNLEADDDEILDPNKLLAVLIYKNVLPRDFEELHQQKGVLSEILGRYEEYIALIEADYKSQIASIEAEISEAEKQHPKDLEELRRIYAMAIVERMPQHFSNIHFGNVNIPLDKLTNHEQFEEIIKSPQLYIRTMQNQQKQLDLSQLQAEVYPSKSFKERCADIEKKSAKFRTNASGKIRELKAKIAKLRTEKFSKIMRANAAHTEDCFDKLGENKELLKFLIFEGFLDDTYYQYTSLFHKGRLSPNDNKFLIQIRSFTVPDPDFQIDNPDEVIAAMREEDFGQAYVLNRHLIDYIFSTPREHAARIARAIQFISAEFDQCDAFFSSYYASGTQAPALINSLVGNWQGFAPAAVERNAAPEHVANLMSCVSTETLAKKLNAEGEISSFISSRLAEVLEHDMSWDLEKLVSLEVEIEDLATIAAYDTPLKFIVEKSLYSVTAENIRFVLEHILEVSDLENLDTQHYSTVLKSGDVTLQRHIAQNFIVYLRNVLLRLEENTDEEVDTILSVLEHDEVSEEFLEEFLVKQNAVFDSFDSIPSAFHSALLGHQMIVVSWANLIVYSRGKGFKPDVLSKYMQLADVKKVLLEDDYVHSDESVDFSRYILKNGDFSGREYRDYVRKIPTTFTSFPKDISDGRKTILIEERVVRLNSDVFEAVSENSEMLASLLAHNITRYLEKKSEYPIDDAVRKALLAKDMSDDEKLNIIDDIDPATVAGDAQLAATIGPIFERSDIDDTSLDSSLIHAIIVHSRPAPVQISLLNQCHGNLTVAEVRKAIEGLPAPFSDIAIFGKMPRIPNTPANMEFAEWLKEREVISSFNTTFLDKEIRINTFRSGGEEQASEDGL